LFTSLGSNCCWFLRTFDLGTPSVSDMLRLIWSVISERTGDHSEQINERLSGHSVYFEHLALVPNAPVLVFKYLNGFAPPYLACQFRCAVIQRVGSRVLGVVGGTLCHKSASFNYRWTCFPVAAAHVWKTSTVSGIIFESWLHSSLATNRAVHAMLRREIMLIYWAH